MNLPATMKYTGSPYFGIFLGPVYTVLLISLLLKIWFRSQLITKKFQVNQVVSIKNLPL